MEACTRRSSLDYRSNYYRKEQNEIPEEKNTGCPQLRLYFWRKAGREECPWEEKRAGVNMVQILQRQSVARRELVFLEYLGAVEYQVYQD